MLLNAVMAGLAGLYASSRSIPLTVAGGVLAAVVAGCYFYTGGRRHRSGKRKVSSDSPVPSLHDKAGHALSSKSEGEGAWPVDGQGFDDFFRRELRPLVWALMKIGAERFEAEDVAQAAMVEVWRRWDSVASPRAYLRKVAVRAFSEGRRQRREFPAEEAREHSLSSAEKLMSTETERLVVRLLGRLPPKQRIVMALTCEEFTPAEIAGIIDAPGTTVRAHLREARSKMRQWLTDEGLL
jgi:RNA polymerase sigma-70 factor (ECF subfamily)